MLNGQALLVFGFYLLQDVSPQLGVVIAVVNSAASSSSSWERSSRSAGQAQSSYRLPEATKRLEEACRSVELLSFLALAQGSPPHEVLVSGMYR